MHQFNTDHLAYNKMVLASAMGLIEDSDFRVMLNAKDFEEPDIFQHFGFQIQSEESLETHSLMNELVEDIRRLGAACPTKMTSLKLKYLSTVEIGERYATYEIGNNDFLNAIKRQCADAHLKHSLNKIAYSKYQ
ncbi:hypothetical protein NTH44_003344 [Vibrio metoecus]|nr:hypothetical protein [Vibrio cholerae]